MRPLPLVLVAAFVVGCAHRYPVNPGGDREAVAGLPLTLGQAIDPVPEGTAVHWDFGDGARATGQVVEHSWARAGQYTLKMEVVDGRGARAATARVNVVRRPPAAALPPGATTVFVFDRIFGRLPGQAALAERFLGKERVAEALAEAARVLGFDPRDPAAVLAAGIDPEEGVGVGVLPGDPGLWVAAGIHDEKAALKTTRDLLSSRTDIVFEPGPDGALVGLWGDSEVLLFAYRGYLYLRLPTGPGQSQASPELVRRAPVEGLFSDAVFSAARVEVGGEDAFAYVKADGFPLRARFEEETEAIERLTAVAAGFTAGEKELSLRFRAWLDAKGLEAVNGTLGSTRRLDLAKRSPAGAMAYVALAFTRKALEEHLAGPDGCRVEASLLGAAGLGCEQFLGLLSGEVAAAFYYDFSGRSGREAAEDGEAAGSVEVVLQAGLADRQKARGALVRGAIESGWEPVPEVADAFRKEVDGVIVGLALAGDSVLAGAGEAFARTLDGIAPERSLAPTLAALAANPGAGHQVAYLDVAAMVDGLRGGSSGGRFDPRELGYLGLLAARFFDDPAMGLGLLLPVRHVLVEAWVEPDGLAGRAAIGLR